MSFEFWIKAQSFFSLFSVWKSKWTVWAAVYICHITKSPIVRYRQNPWTRKCHNIIHSTWYNVLCIPRGRRTTLSAFVINVFDFYFWYVILSHQKYTYFLDVVINCMCKIYDCPSNTASYSKSDGIGDGRKA